MNTGWNTKADIAVSIIPKLESYKKLVSSGNSYSIPNWVLNEGEELTEQEMNKRWLVIVDKMIFAFKLELESEDYSNLEKERLQMEGLNLFAKYFLHLWD